MLLADDQVGDLDSVTSRASGDPSCDVGGEADGVIDAIFCVVQAEEASVCSTTEGSANGALTEAGWEWNTFGSVRAGSVFYAPVVMFLRASDAVPRHSTWAAV